MFYYDLKGLAAASFIPRPLPPLTLAPGQLPRLFLAQPAEGPARRSFAATDALLLAQKRESARWLSSKALAEDADPDLQADGPVQAAIRSGGLRALRLAPEAEIADTDFLPRLQEKNVVHLLAVGDVGAQLLTGLHVLGSDCIDRIGIYDLNQDQAWRWAFEENQIMLPFEPDALPPVEVLDPEALFDCDVFIFTASAGVPKLGAQGDVRLAQLAANRRIISAYAQAAREARFRGLFCVVSDPVDQLAQAVWQISNCDQAGRWDDRGLAPEQVQGFGLGVMNARAAYYARRDPRFASYLTEGRAFGPHGEDLVIANSIAHYDDGLSRQLTDLTAHANLKMREMGFKPFVAPAWSSGALSILETLRGHWHYGSVFLGGIYMGVKNRYTPAGQEHEILDLPQALLERIEQAQAGLHAFDMERGE